MINETGTCTFDMMMFKCNTSFFLSITKKFILHGLMEIHVF